MKQISLLIKPASSSCNLRCSYCFYHDVSEERSLSNYGIMDQKTTAMMIQRVFEEVDEDGLVIFSFQGGEPTVAGLAYFQHFVHLVNQYRKQQKVQYALQTNGTLIDEQWASFFKAHQFLIGVSLDGYQKNMDQFRYDAKKKGVYFQVLKGIQCLKKQRVDFNILTVVTKSLATSPQSLFQYYKQNHFDFVQLIPCLPSLNHDFLMDEQALTPQLYASFFKAFFDCWYQDVLQGGRMEINLFMNLLEMLQGRPPYQCGMIGQCFAQHVVEADGSVYPCDFYVLDQYCIGHFEKDTLKAMHHHPVTVDFVQERAMENKQCEACPFRKMCHGGCKRQNICYLNEEMCGYRDFLSHAMPYLHQLLQRF